MGREERIIQYAKIILGIIAFALIYAKL